MPRIIAAVLVVALPWAAPAAAQSTFGDTDLSFQGGVVTDDDLVPGRGTDSPFLAEEEARAPVGPPRDGFIPGDDRSRPQNSRNLIGPDGQLVR
ncbi:hypothetical protein [Acuticoccus sp.]|uniref:hypothetical protein n=1 Tax=Acuticoccus sp. TaxID=1904378 RepID=UPI003B51552D